MLPRHGVRSERTPRRASNKAAAGEKPRASWKAVWPEVRGLIRQRRAALALGLVLIAISRVCGLVLPASTKYFLDDIVAKHNSAHLMPLIAAVALATMIQAGTGFALTHLLSKSAHRLIYEWRCRVAQHVSRLPVTFFDAHKSGEMVTRIMVDVEGVKELVGTGLVEFIGGLLTAALSFFLLIRISAPLTLMVACVGSVYAVGLFFAFRTLRPIFRERSRLSAAVTGRLNETIGGIRVVKGYHAERREDEVFSTGARTIMQNIMKSLTSVSMLSLSATALLGVIGGLVMFVGGRQMLHGTLKTGEFVSFSMLLGFLIAPVFQVVNVGTQLTEAVAGMERTRELLSEAREDQDPRRTVELGAITGEVRFDDVSFEYEEDKPVLRNVSFDAPAGTVTALVGASGSGKSTTIGLICAFHTPRAGCVTVDGVDLSTVHLSSYRTQIGVVLQESFLFDGTIRENVAFSKPNATKEEIEEACRIARVDEFALRFEEGYDTIVGERGVKLSGGQRQRVSIARAILADPRILILDEATSSLDSETEALIQEGLKYLMRGRTTFVIAHRLSTIRRADQILVMENGRVEERGTHDQLYALQGRYWDLYTRQHGFEQNLFLAPGEGDSKDHEKEKS